MARLSQGFGHLDARTLLRRPFLTVAQTECLEADPSGLRGRDWHAPERDLAGQPDHIRPWP